MPTDLPRPKRKRAPNRLSIAVPKHPVLGGVLNGFMVGTVLLLFALVLLQQKRWVDGAPGTVADAFLQQAHTALVGGDSDDTLAN